MTTKDYTLTLTKEIGKLWMLKDIKPFHKNFDLFFNQDLEHDFIKVTACGCTNYILDLLAGEDKRMSIELRIAAERVDLPGYIEFELVKPYSLSARYYVNNCPGKPQLETWADASAKQYFKAYPVFAYIKRK